MIATVPALADCQTHKIEPFEYQVLLALAEVQEKTAGGVFLAADTKDKEQFATMRGRIIALSPAAFTYQPWPEGTRTPQIGDVVAFPKFSGTEIEGADGKKYKLATDKAILAVIERGTPNAA